MCVKQARHCKRMSVHCEIEDNMLMRAEIVPTLESLVASPLLKFIQFAAHYCVDGGTRRDIITNCDFLRPR